MFPHQSSRKTTIRFPWRLFNHIHMWSYPPYFSRGPWLAFPLHAAPLPKNSRSQVWEENWGEAPAGTKSLCDEPLVLLLTDVLQTFQRQIETPVTSPSTDGSRNDRDVLHSIHMCHFWNPHWQHPFKDILFPTLTTVRLTIGLYFIQIDNYSIILYSFFYDITKNTLLILLMSLFFRLFAWKKKVKLRK